MQTHPPSCPQTCPGGPEPVSQHPSCKFRATRLFSTRRKSSSWRPGHSLEDCRPLSTHFQEITCSLEESTFCFESGYMKVGPVKRCGLHRGPQDTMDRALSHRQRLVSGAHVQQVGFAQIPGLHVSGLHPLPELVWLLLPRDFPTSGKDRRRSGEEFGEGGKKEETKEGWREGKEERRDQGESKRQRHRGRKKAISLICGRIRTWPSPSTRDFRSFHLWTMKEMVAGWLKLGFPWNFKALSCFILIHWLDQEHWAKHPIPSPPAAPHKAPGLLSYEASISSVACGTPHRQVLVRSSQSSFAFRRTPLPTPLPWEKLPRGPVTLTPLFSKPLASAAGSPGIPMESYSLLNTDMF